MSKKLHDTLIPKGRTIYFNEEAHKYTNELGIAYTSTTTIIKKYEVHKDMEAIAKACERIGKNPNHAKYLHYKGKTAKQLLKEWEETTKNACEFGTIKHSYLEQSVKNSNGYIDDKIATLDEIIAKHNYGRLTIKDFKDTGIDIKYPTIFEVIVKLTKAGYYIYAEIGVYDDFYGVSGLIDILCINHKTNEFLILDWKTNKAPIRFEAGYYEKHTNGLLNLDKFIPKEDVMQHPLTHLADSTGNHYTLQLSTYAYLCETFGYTFKGILLVHIRPIEQTVVSREHWQESVELYPIKYLKKEVMSMLDDFRMKRKDLQTTLML